MQTENDTSKAEYSPQQDAGEGCSGATCSASNVDPYEREAAKAAIHTLQRELQRERKRYALLEEDYAKLREERDEAIQMREWDNRAISIARHYGHDDISRETEDSRIRPALVLEKAVAVAIDGWVDGNSVTIQLCREEVEQWVALVYVHGQDVTAFSANEIGLCEDVQEVWMSSAVLAALDHARALPAESESLPNSIYS
jgi:hypothetical protein